MALKKIILLVVFFAFIISFKKVNKKYRNSLPNIVLIMTDDQGYGDIGSYGATGFTTPNLDKLASEGMRFTNNYAAQSVCSASRAGLLTGCYPNRIGITGALFPQSKTGLNNNEITIAEMLKEKGYSTGIFGKWHLGHLKEFLPLQHGFDEYLGLPYSNDMWPVKADRFPPLPLIEGNSIIDTISTLEDQDRLSELYTKKAVNFINKNKKNPFFLYLPHTMPHVPLGFGGKFKGKSEQGVYGDVIMEIDWSVGEILKALEKNGLADNTIFIFTSDNGPWISYGNHAGSSGGLREAKLTNWEGGQKVPFIVKWPGKIPKNIVNNQLTSNIDVFTTLAAITKSKIPEHAIDGYDLSELWLGKEVKSKRQNYYYYQGKNHLSAVRNSTWKLVLPHTYRSYEKKLPGNNGNSGGAEDITLNEMELYNMISDPGERINVISQHPEVVKEMLKIVENARKELGDLNVNLKFGKGTREVGFVK
jgi:arylsulfatase